MWADGVSLTEAALRRIGGLAAESTAQVAGIPVDIRNAPVIPGACGACCEPGRPATVLD